MVAETGDCDDESCFGRAFEISVGYLGRVWLQVEQSTMETLAVLQSYALGSGSSHGSG